VINTQQIIENLQLGTPFLTEDLIIILGPTASGKTKLAVDLAQEINAEMFLKHSRNNKKTDVLIISKLVYN